jgi:hypothetical protein
MTVRRASLGAKTSSRKQGPDFDLVGTLRIVVIHETLGAARTRCWSGSSLLGCISIQVTVILSVMSGMLPL